MTQENGNASKLWVIEQVSKIQDALKEDLHEVQKRMDNYVSHAVCDERRNSETLEKKRIDDKIDSIDEDVKKMNQTFDDNWNNIRMWIWTILGGIIGELIMLLSNSFSGKN